MLNMQNMHKCVFQTNFQWVYIQQNLKGQLQAMTMALRLCETSMCKIRCEQADFAEFAALPTNDRQFVIPNMFSIENWIIISCGSCNRKLFSKFEEFTIEDFSQAMAIQIRRLRFARLNVFGLCRVDLVRKIETGLECGQWLLRKLRNSVFMQQDYKRRPASEIVDADSRGRIFSACT